MSQAVGVRVLRRLSQSLRSEGVSQSVCITFPDLEQDITMDLARAVRRKDYKEAAKQANELVFMSMAQNELCMWRRRSRTSEGDVYRSEPFKSLPPMPVRRSHRRHR